MRDQFLDDTSDDRRRIRGGKVVANPVARIDEIDRHGVIGVLPRPAMISDRDLIRFERGPNGVGVARRDDEARRNGANPFRKRTQARTHIVHHSAATALGLLRDAKRDGLPLTAETCPHYLHFTAETIPDGATPSGQSMAALALLRLARLTGDAGREVTP